MEATRYGVTKGLTGMKFSHSYLKIFYFGNKIHS